MKRLELIEMPGHVGLLALGQPWMTDAHWADLMTVCKLGLDLAGDDEYIRELSVIGNDMLMERVAEVEEMRQVLGTLVQWVSKQPNTKIYASVQKRLRELDEQERLSGNS